MDITRCTVIYLTALQSMNTVNRHTTYTRRSINVSLMVATSSLGQSHASAYHRSLAVSSTTISYSLYVVILGVCLRCKPHWIFQIFKYVIEGREELTSCSSLIHSHMFPLPDVSYRQVGNLSFGQ